MKGSRSNLTPLLGTMRRSTRRNDIGCPESREGGGRGTGARRSPSSTHVVIRLLSPNAASCAHLGLDQHVQRQRRGASRKIEHALHARGHRGGGDSGERGANRAKRSPDGRRMARARERRAVGRQPRRGSDRGRHSERIYGGSITGRGETGGWTLGPTGEQICENIFRLF